MPWKPVNAAEPLGRPWPLEVSDGLNICIPPEMVRSEKAAMPQTTVTIPSTGLRLAGTMRMPDGIAAGERRAAFLVLHGFGSNRSSSNVLRQARC